MILAQTDIGSPLERIVRPQRRKSANPAWQTADAVVACAWSSRPKAEYCRTLE